jgi:hypothetical protein
MRSNNSEIIKKFIRRLLLARGYVVYSVQGYHARMESALQSLSKRHHVFNTIVDVGASDGRWSSLAMKAFPSCNYLLIEANQSHEKALDRFRAEHSNVHVALAAAGDRVGEIGFDASNSFIGQASHVQTVSQTTTVPMTTIDQ